MKTLTKFALAAFAATALFPVAAMAQDAKNQGYLVDASGSIVTSATGLCWHTSDWTPARAVEPCDPTIRPLAAAPAPTPAVVVAAPAVMPPLAVAPPPPQKVSFSADALFAFDKSELKSEGRVMLDGLVRQLNGATYDVILVTGHADRIGSVGYNQKLSERRANAVKDYLASNNIPASRIDAKGKGEMEPITKIDDCKGAKSAKVIACLQPDRRVDVDMQGTKL